MLDAAAKLFGEKGFRGTTISDISSLANVNRALISYHFGSKSGLYSALLDMAVETAMTRFEKEKLDSHEPAPERKLVRILADVYTSMPHLAPMLVRDFLDLDYFSHPENYLKLSRFLTTTKRVLTSIDLGPRARTYDSQVAHLILVGSIIYFTITSPFRELMKGKAEGILDPPPLDHLLDILSDMMSCTLRDRSAA